MTVNTFLSANVLIAYTAYLVGTVSPGPSNLAIMSLAMGAGRKAILVWLSIVSPAIPASGGAAHTAPVVLGCMGIGVCVFSGYAILFSTDTARRVYSSIRRWLDGSLAVAFSVAGVKLLTSRS